MIGNVNNGQFVVGNTYKINNLGTTTNTQWNTIAGTSGITYTVGSVFVASTAGTVGPTGSATQCYFIKSIENHPNYLQDPDVKLTARITVGISPQSGPTGLVNELGSMKIEFDPSTYISETQVKFITPAKSVGAYDLVIFNPAKTTPFIIPATSVVVPASIKYVQILLPFAPRPNPATETGWYKNTRIIPATSIQPGRGYVIATIGTTNFGAIGAGSNTIGTGFIASAVGTGTGTVIDYTSIPYEYWEGMDIEVFVGGKRLRKSPIEVYDETLGPDSPSGNKMLEAEFAVNKNVGAYVRLTTPPEPGVKVVIQKRTGKTWVTDGVALSDATSDPAKFIRAKGVDLSE